MTIRYPLPVSEIAAMPWSEWIEVKSMDDGVFRARQKIGQDWTLQGAEDTAESRFSELPTVIIEVTYGYLDAPCERVTFQSGAGKMHAKLVAAGLGVQLFFHNQQESDWISLCR